MKRIFLLILVITGLAFSSGYRCSRGKYRSADSLLVKLQADRESMDGYYLIHGDDLITLAKAPGVDTLAEIMDTLSQAKDMGKWPDKIEYSYDILKDTIGRVRYIDQISSTENPYSIRIYIHYFDEQGNTYAFRRKEGMFFEGAKSKLILDDHLMYYNKDFSVIGESDTVKDINHQPIKLTQEERNKMDFKYNIYRNLNNCLNGYGIRLKH
jgi:hypothetical protein